MGLPHRKQALRYLSGLSLGIWLVLAPVLVCAATVEREVGVMGTTLAVTVTAPTRPAALAASEAAVTAVAAAEQRLSTWREDSELTRVNRAQVGAVVRLSPALAGDVAAALRWSRATGGAFNPGMGELVSAWGLRTGGRLPTRGEIEHARQACRLDGVRLSGRTLVRLVPGFRFEEGGFGKGAALDDAAAALAVFPAVHGTLNLGGQVRCFGGGAEVLVVRPDDRRRAVLALTLPGGSVATSGNSERKLEAGGCAIGHLLDPRSGEPAPDFGSVTVWAESAIAADCVSTALFVMGPEDGVRWASRQPGVEAVALVPLAGDRVAALASSGLVSRLRTLDGSIDLRFVAAADVQPRTSTTPARR